VNVLIDLTSPARRSGLALGDGYRRGGAHIVVWQSKRPWCACRASGGVFSRRQRGWQLFRIEKTAWPG